MDDSHYMMAWSFAMLGTYVAHAFIGIACHRIGARGGGKAFLAASWLMGAQLLIFSAGWTVGNLGAFWSSTAMWTLDAYHHSVTISHALLVLHRVVLVVAIGTFLHRLRPALAQGKRRVQDD